MFAKRFCFGAAVITAVLCMSEDADAQYRNFTFGFEGGYQLMGAESDLNPHMPTFGMFGGWKAGDRWWLYGRAMLAFSGEADPSTQNTAIVLQFVPAAVRYYFKTDSVRPYLGLTNAFHTLLNTGPAVRQTVWWGPGVTGGIELKLSRDLFFGLEGDAFYMINFTGADTAIVTLTGQIIFFL